MILQMEASFLFRRFTSVRNGAVFVKKKSVQETLKPHSNILEFDPILAKNFLSLPNKETAKKLFGPSF